MPNYSQLHSPQQWEKWRQSGALGLPGNPIHSVKKFLETLKAGDTIWVLFSANGEPLAIDEMKILSIVFESRYGHRMVCECHPSGDPIYVDDDWYVDDAVNKYHGVCRSRSEAELYLAYRQQTYVPDPDDEKYRDDSNWNLYWE